MEGRVDLSALERSRMLSQLTTSGLSRLRETSSILDADSRSQMSTQTDRSRGMSPTTLQQYAASHFLPAPSLHPSGSSYAMMASYLAGTGGHVPDSIKHLLPDMQQYWFAAAHSEGYARYLLENMYYPYLPYMPATESLALFAHNSASAAQLEALQAQAVQQRLYDLHKEALSSQGVLPPAIYPYSHLYPPSTGQMEATNLSLPSSSRTKQGEKVKDEETRRLEEKKESRESRNRSDSCERKDNKTTEQCLDFSKHNETHSDKVRKSNKTDDKDKIKSSQKHNKSSLELSKGDVDKETTLSKSLSPMPDRKRHLSDNSLKREMYIGPKNDSTSHVKASLHSPQSRLPSALSSERPLTSFKVTDRVDYSKGPYSTSSGKASTEQDMPENLCIKDKQKEQKLHDAEPGSKTECNVIKTLTVDTTTTVTVTATLNIITSDIGTKERSYKRKASSVSPQSQKSPSLSQTCTTTTYSLPYYHNLFSRTQPPDNKRIHATTYVPEVGTVSSPVAGAPAVIQVKEPKTSVITGKADKKGVSDKSSDVTEPQVSSLECGNRKTEKESKESDMSKQASTQSVSTDKDVVDVSNKTTPKQEENKQQNSEPYVNSSDKKSDIHSVKNDKVEINAKLTCFVDNATSDSSVIRSINPQHSKCKHKDLDSVSKEEKSESKKETNESDVNPTSKADAGSCEKTQKSLKEKQSLKSKEVPSPVLEKVDVITVSDNEEKDSEVTKRSELCNSYKQVENKSAAVKTFAVTKQTTLVKPISVSKSNSDTDYNDTVKSRLGDKVEKESTPQVSGIPVGIAVARQRNIAPKITTDKDTLKKGPDDSTKPRNPVADVKPIRPLKVIRPSTKGANSSPKVEKRNELPANLIVTGGTNPSNVFWPPDDQTGNRTHIPAQLLSGNHAAPPTSWFGQATFPMATALTSSNSAGNTGAQIPLNAPTGYKLAQDSLTGQILLVPSGTELFDSTRMLNGIPLGNTLNTGSHFGPATFVTGGSSSTPSAIVSQTSLFPGQNVLTDRPANLDLSLQPFMPIFGPNVMPSADLAVKEAKLTTTVGQNAVAVTNSGSHLHATSQSSENTETKTVLAQPHAIIRTDGSVTGCDISPFTFSAQTVPTVVFNPALIQQPQSVADTPVVAEDRHAGSEVASVQSRGTSPMLPASDSCAEEAGELKSDDNSDEIVDICDDEKTQKSDDDENCLQNEDKANVKTLKELDVINNDHNDIKITLPEPAAVHCRDDKRVKSEKELSIAQTDEKGSKHTDSSDNESISVKPTKSNRNIFKDFTEYNPFMDPQVLQAADGLELLSALAEKSAPVVSCDSKERISTADKQNDSLVKRETKPQDKDVPTVEKPLDNSRNTKSNDKNSVKEEKMSDKKKSRIKCGYPFKTKIESKPVSVEEKKMTTFCGITIPEDDDVIDSIEMEMKMRLAELQKRYKEKQKQLAKLTPKKAKDSEREADKQKLPDSPRGPGRPKKRPHESCSGDFTNSLKSPKVKKTDPSVRTSPTGSSANNNSSHQGHPVKRKNMAEMIVDRVFRKTGSSFRIPLSKKVNLIAPARIEFPGATSVQEKSDQIRMKKSLDFKKLIKRSRLSQLNGKEGFVGGVWAKKYGEKRLSFHSELKTKKKKAENVTATEPVKSPEGGLGLLAEYAEKSREDAKKKRTAEEATVNLSPDSPNKKRKPGRPKKCDVVRPGVTETIVAKQCKHMDFLRWQAEEPKQERKISLEGKTPLKPLYLDEWNVRRSERIFLSDPSPQTSPNTISPATKPKLSPGVKSLSPGSKIKPSVTVSKSKPLSPKSDKAKSDKAKKSQTLNMSMKVKKKYSSGLSQQQRSREKTTELLKASRDRLSQSRMEKKVKQATPTKVKPASDSDTDDMPLSCLKAKPKLTVLPDCTLHQDGLEDGMRILVFMDGLFHEGELKAIRPPDIYGAVLDNERKTRPHYYSLEEILKEAIKDTKPDCAEQLKEGTRICAYWSQQFSCLYPGTISKGNPEDDDETDKDLFNVDFDDSDTGKIPLDHIRIIPQDFPHVEYDPNPLLLLTKRRRTLSISESSESRKSQSESASKKPQSDTPRESKEPKVKRGPGRPPKTDRLVSMESVGDEDVFTNDSKTDDEKRNKTSDSDNESDVVLVQPRDLWQWSGSSTKRPGMKGKARKEFYKTIYRHKEHISIGDCAVFISTGRPNLPYVGRIESFWEAWSGQMVVKVKWFYHPEETKGGKRLQKMKGALFRSDHEDENDVQTISHKCEVISYSEYRRRVDVISHENNDDVYYLAGSYEPTIGHIKFEPGVV